jgi:hypothetical protein
MGRGGGGSGNGGWCREETSRRRGGWTEGKEERSLDEPDEAGG